MRIKKFIGATMTEAVGHMKRELGENAVILQTRKISNGGLMSLPGKEALEITAAIEPESKIRDKAQKTVPLKAYESLTGKSRGGKKASVMEMNFFKEEMSEIRFAVEQIADSVRFHNFPTLPNNLDLVMKQLLENEVDMQLAQELIQEIQMELKGNEYKDLRLILDILLKRVAEYINISDDSERAVKKPRVIALIGPTGVGKTTTIAKLATNNKLLHHKKVALISQDTYRIAAVDQLKTFANIADIPLEVVYSPEDLKKAVAKFKDFDLIYIDTTGRSQKDIDHLKELKSYISAVKPDEVHLVLSVTTKYRDMIEIINRFGKLSVNNILFSKLDETNSLGVILNVMTKIKAPVSYLTNGQNVPDDIERANPEKMAKMIVKRRFM